MVASERIVTSIPPVVFSLLASTVALSADDFNQSIASRPSITVVKNGESATRPEKCRATLIGPGINQPDPFPATAALSAGTPPCA